MDTGLLNLALALPLAGEAQLDISGPVLLLVLAVAVALTTRQVRVPYTVALVCVGLVVGLSTSADAILQVPDDKLIPDLIFFVLLPPLLFEGCVNIDLETFRRSDRLILLLAFVGTVITAGLVGIVVYHWLGAALQLTWPMALLIGVVVSPTDPVSVLALFKELGVDKDLSVVVEGESVLNDGVGVVLFLILLQLIGGAQMSVSQACGMFLWEVGGGSLVGLLVGYLAYRLLAKIDDRLIEVIISLLVAYGSYLVAAELEVSGVLAVVVAGLVIGNYGKTLGMSPTTRVTLTSFWEVVGFLANSVLFLLIGLKLEGSLMLQYAWPIVGIFLAGLAARAVAVAACGGLAVALRQRVRWPWLAVGWWGGVRGSIPVAMALGLLGGQEGLPSLQVTEIVAIVFGIVLLSLVVQGTTMKRLLRSCGLTGRPEEQHRLEAAVGQAMALKASLRELTAMREERQISEPVFEELRTALQTRKDELRRHVAALLADNPALHGEELERAAVRLLHAQRAALDEAVQRGVISEETGHELARDVAARLHSDLAPTFRPESLAPPDADEET